MYDLNSWIIGTRYCKCRSKCMCLCVPVWVECRQTLPVHKHGYMFWHSKNHWITCWLPRGEFQTRHMVISNNFEGFSMNSALFGVVNKNDPRFHRPQNPSLPISKTFAGPQWGARSCGTGDFSSSSGEISCVYPQHNEHIASENLRCLGIEIEKKGLELQHAI